MNKRTFLKNTAAIGLGSLVSFKAIGRMVDAVAHLPAAVLAEDDDFWKRIRGSYRIKTDYINPDEMVVTLNTTELRMQVV